MKSESVLVSQAVSADMPFIDESIADLNKRHVCARQPDRDFSKLVIKLIYNSIRME